MIIQQLYWPDIIDAVRKELNNCDTSQHTKQSNKKYGKLSAKLAEKILCNTVCRSIRTIHHKNKGQERKLTYKGRYND